MIEQLVLRNDIVLVLLAPNPEDQPTASGLIVERALKPVVCYGRVLRVGPDVDPENVKKGDLVAFPPSAGDPYPHKDYELLFVHEGDIAFVLDKKDES